MFAVLGTILLGLITALVAIILDKGIPDLVSGLILIAAIMSGITAAAASFTIAVKDSIK